MDAPTLGYISNEVSTYPLFIRMKFEETNCELAIGTGFIYEWNDIYYLITNGHCITGVNPENNSRISANAGFPTIIHTNIRRFENYNVIPNLNYHRRYVGGMSIRIPLYDDEEYTKPTWLIHPTLGYNIDVVAIPIQHKKIFPNNLEVNALNKSFLFKSNTKQSLGLRVADEVYILGYPLGITDIVELPIWKKASIATEPNIPYKEMPIMLVDTATRPGMSGSPVILMKRGLPGVQAGDVSYNADGEYLQFIGIYSGRVSSKNEKTDAQLGIVWFKEVIEEILIGQKKGTVEFQNI